MARPVTAITDVPIECMPFPLLVQLSACNKALAVAAKRELLCRDRGVDLYHYLKSMGDEERAARIAKMSVRDCALVLRIILVRCGVDPSEPFFVPMSAPTTLYIHALTRIHPAPQNDADGAAPDLPPEPVAVYEANGNLILADLVASLYDGCCADAVDDTLMHLLYKMGQKMEEKAKEFGAFMSDARHGECDVVWHTGMVSIWRVEGMMRAAPRAFILGHVDPVLANEAMGNGGTRTCAELALQNILAGMLGIGA